MKAFLPLTLAMLIGFSLLHADTDKEALGKLAARIGDKFWSPPEKRLVRATIYGKGAGDGKSDEKIGLRHATEKEAGTLAVPQWLPRGSMVKIHTEHGVLAYIAADEGPSVEARHAAKQSGETEEQKAASVLDFCAAEQLWPFRAQAHGKRSRRYSLTGLRHSESAAIMTKWRLRSRPLYPMRVYPSLIRSP